MEYIDGNFIGGIEWKMGWGWQFNNFGRLFGLLIRVGNEDWTMLGMLGLRVVLWCWFYEIQSIYRSLRAVLGPLNYFVDFLLQTLEISVESCLESLLLSRFLGEARVVGVGVPSRRIAGIGTFDAAVGLNVGRLTLAEVRLFAVVFDLRFDLVEQRHGVREGLIHWFRTGLIQIIPGTDPTFLVHG
jgi:hypothetical protein